MDNETIRLKIFLKSSNFLIGMTADFQTQIGGMPTKYGNYLLGFTVYAEFERCVSIHIFCNFSFLSVGWPWGVVANSNKKGLKKISTLPQHGKISKTLN